MREVFEPIEIKSIMYVCWNTECNHEIALDAVHKLGLTTCPECGESLRRDEYE